MFCINRRRKEKNAPADDIAGSSVSVRRHYAAVGISGLMAPSNESDDINSNDPVVLRKLVMMTRQQCAEERKRNDDLMKAFLPPSYKLAYGEGHRELAGKM